MSEVEIQCPDCGGMLISGMIETDYDEGHYCCNKCGKIYTEAEIREGCGL
ncbi:MAG: Zn finger protein [Lokiarchaeia virus VerdaV4]|uniref:Zn finger protein n=1 Tax=Lokiarchaeia virus VerdaV4 TaxID=3070172 RepID=A0AA35CNR0_9CAUD|nr:MAG: Zn finger protein [Lokiarchaeia virus VerdaV4]BDI54993.1 MAG: Zn finger protein [Lokiarchaeia virus VerdaV4]